MDGRRAGEHGQARESERNARASALTSTGAIRSSATLPSIRFHDLRHTAATLLLAQGVSPRVIMETLGHSQISLTLDTYSHILPALQQEAADRMDAALRS
jgi:integrase